MTDAPPGSSASSPGRPTSWSRRQSSARSSPGASRPGDPIGTEFELVKQFGVNRSTVREGIRLLEQSGLVAREPSRRLSVAVPHYHRLATRMSRALILQQVTFRELWHTSRALEPAAVDQAMDNAHRGGSGRARRQHRRDAQGCSTIRAAVAELDAEFHKLIGQGRAQSRAAAGQGALQHAGAAGDRLHHLNNPRRHPAPDRGAQPYPRRHPQRRDREKGRLWVDRHLRDWKAGFERSGTDLDSPVDLMTQWHMSTHEDPGGLG